MKSFALVTIGGSALSRWITIWLVTISRCSAKMVNNFTAAECCSRDTTRVFEIRSPQNGLIELHPPAREQFERPAKLRLSRLPLEHLSGPQKTNCSPNAKEQRFRTNRHSKRWCEVFR